MNASPDRTAMLEAERADAKKRLARAVEDVLEGHSISSAYRSRGVSEQALRKALRARGWVAPHFRDGVRRRTFGSGKRHGTQRLAPQAALRYGG